MSMGFIIVGCVVGKIFDLRVFTLPVYGVTWMTSFSHTGNRQTWMLAGVAGAKHRRSRSASAAVARVHGPARREAEGVPAPYHVRLRAAERVSQRASRLPYTDPSLIHRVLGFTKARFGL